MGIPVNIDSLLHPQVVESARIEFKADFNPEAVIHTLCAFANDIDNLGGGYLVIGVAEENGVPVFPVQGITQERIDGILKKLREYCHFIEPLYEPVVSPELVDDKYVIVIWAPGGYGRPYKASQTLGENRSHKCYYIRKFSSTVVASATEEKELFYISQNIPFDDRPHLGAEIADLDIGLMRAHLKEIGSALYPASLTADLLAIARDLQIIAGPPENLKPLNVGILMFTEQPEKYFRYARIEVADIPDPTGARMVEKTFGGPLQRQLRDALQFIKNYVIKEMTLKQRDRAEALKIYNYPYAAIEEILANAVYHRSYQINEPITVRITPDAMEITSFPGFDRGISDEEIRQYNIRARAYRNRRIGDFLKELKLIEGRNTGFPTVYKALTENGSPLPRFTMDAERNYLSVTLPVHPRFAPTAPQNDKAADYQQRIIGALAQAEMSLTELALTLGYKGISRKLSQTVDNLIATGRIHTVSAGRSVKLSLKPAGR